MTTTPVRTVLVLSVALATSLLLCPRAQAVSSLYWSFDALANGNGAANTNPTDNDGFGTATFTRFNGTGGSSNNMVNGGASYTHEGTTWAGSGTTDTPGHSAYWSVSSTTTASMVGAGFTIALSTLGLYDLNMRFDIRAATNSLSYRPGNQFSFMQYSVDGGTEWSSLGTSTTWDNGSGTPFETETYDFSGIDALENQANLLLRFTFASGPVPASTATTYNIRIDNVLITAVPEPGVAGMMLLGMAAVGLRRRRAPRVG